MNALIQAVRNLRGRRPVASEAPARRVEPRISKRLTVHMVGFELYSTNVTAAGLQLECPGHRLAALRTRWDPAATPVQIELPDGQHIGAECSVTYVSECDDDYLIGLAFEQMDERAKGPWQSYLARLDAP